MDIVPLQEVRRGVIGSLEINIPQNGVVSAGDSLAECRVQYGLLIGLCNSRTYR
jgi:hypothetical protein